MIWAAMSSAGVGPLCFLKSTVNAVIYQDILEHFMLPSADKFYGDGDFIFQQDLAPAHTAKGTKSWFNDYGVTVFDWSANSPDLNPIENLQCRWPKGCYQRNLSFNYTWAVPQADCLHATPYWCINSCKRRLNQMNILFRSLTVLFKISFLLILCNNLILWDTEFGLFMIFQFF